MLGFQGTSEKPFGLDVRPQNRCEHLVANTSSYGRPGCGKLTAMLTIRAVWRCLVLASPWAAIAMTSTFAAPAAPSGEEVYTKRCSVCHDQANPRIPPRDSLKKIPASRILKVLDFGAMMQIAYPCLLYTSPSPRD